MAKREYYDISNLLSTDANWLMLLGKRANGKSYQVKMTCLTDAYENDVEFVYLRRYSEDIKQYAVTSYFDDMPIAKITKRKYNSVKAYQGNIYFINIKDGKEKDKKKIGRYCSLNSAIRYKSQTFPNVRNIIYEEFITDELYLDDEPRKLQQFVSTVFRLEKGKVFLVGNTLSRVCPYFNEWCLEGVLKQKQGTIDVYHYHTDDGHGNDSVIDIAVEQCANTHNDNTMFFGDASKQIVTGEWDVKEVAKLPKLLYQYEMVYEILIVYQAFKFVLQLLVEPVNGGLICYVYPYTKEREIYRQITDVFSDMPNVTSKLDIDRKPEKLIKKCLTLDKICYSDNLTGSDFKKVLEKLKL